MEDQRVNKRISAPEGTIVINQINSKVMGKMVDVSANGFLLGGREPYSAGMIFQLNLCLPVQNKTIELSIGAECIWSDPQTSGMVFGGFQIIDISESDQKQLDAIILQLTMH